jgi:hypothetical protein
MEDLECSKRLKLIKNLEEFKIVDLSAGSLHNAADSVKRPSVPKLLQSINKQLIMCCN